MANLDNLRPEVREAVEYCDSIFNDADNGEWATIRAELFRLAARNAELEAKATRDHDWVSDLLVENKKAEAELAALKAKIAKAPRGMAHKSLAPSTVIVSELDDDPSDFGGVYMRLLVEK